nr:hypothetical protein [Alicyclobacillus sp. SP_1]
MGREVAVVHGWRLLAASRGTEGAVGVLERLGVLAEGGPTLLGVTATPTRADKRVLGDIFERVTYEGAILQRILGGYRMKRPVSTRYSTCPSGIRKAGYQFTYRICCQSTSGRSQLRMRDASNDTLRPDRATVCILSDMYLCHTVAASCT